MNTRTFNRPMVRLALVLIGVAALGLALAACQKATETPAAEAPAAVEATEVPTEVPTEAPTEVEAMVGVTITVATSDELGDYVADADGMTLYLFTDDSEGTSTCTGDCATTWPPLLTEGEPVAGEGVDATLLGTIDREDGTTQVTYNGWPLYYYSGDAAPGDLNGQGVNDKWYVVSPAGEKVEGGE